MTDEISLEFVRKEKRLIDLCKEIAVILNDSDRQYVSEIESLESVVQQLPFAQTIEDKREIASIIKSKFHKEGIFDWEPSNINFENWRAKVEELYDLVWIYQESKYSHVWK
jgi:hypothetical protein